MKTTRAGLILLGVTFASSLYAKGLTVQIRISGGELASVIDHAAGELGQFTVWAGRGAFRNGVEEEKGFIIEWSKGVVQRRRSGLARYEIRFYTGCKGNDWDCRTAVPKLSYVVQYEYDAVLDQGYVYLPGGTDEWYQLNISSILRNLEGNWFVASREWNTYLRTVLERPGR